MAKQMYRIWSNEHGLWWRPNSRGYTAHIFNAGLYTKKEAEEITVNSWGREEMRPAIDYSGLKKLEKKAQNEAIKLHKGQGWGDYPYSEHLRRVASRVAPEYRAAAWLHDIIEDGHLSYKEVLSKFGKDIAVAVALLTRRGGQNYYNYIKEIARSQNVMAILVKIADLQVNLFAGAKESVSLARRYVTALEQLGVIE